MKHFLLFGLGAAAFASPPYATAQNVSDYDIMPDPILLLLREPAVQKDLGLTRKHTIRLYEINHSFGRDLLAARNLQSEENRETIAKAVKETRYQVVLLELVEDSTIV